MTIRIFLPSREISPPLKPASPILIDPCSPISLIVHSDYSETLNKLGKISRSGAIPTHRSFQNLVDPPHPNFLENTSRVKSSTTLFMTPNHTISFHRSEYLFPQSKDKFPFPTSPISILGLQHFFPQWTIFPITISTATLLIKKILNHFKSLLTPNPSHSSVDTCPSN
jgi:hypothetical protein